ncbi:nucleotidyltransferase family protein [Cohnella panacarvi]|uniref:nucleotidyltransferase family protein n=1 Tax=Cohnella panacarvi TaxID=400776 RepID=UPI00047CFAF3|nr:nucleotidyltransferase family protein [Cohnella panacarvi]
MLVRFLQALYDPQIDLGYSEKDYAGLMTVIERSAIGAQVYALLKSGGRLSQIPPPVRDRLTRNYQALYIQNLLIKRETEHLLREFDSNGIAVIPLKGTLMAERFFGHFAARGTSDIDLLIKPEQIQEAIACTVKMGYSTAHQHDPTHYHLEWSKPLEGASETLTVELHWGLASGGSSRMKMDSAWETSERLPGHENVRMLGTTYTFYSLCLHGASHQMDSLKHALDIYQLLRCHRERIDMDEVWRQALADGTRNRVRAALSVVYGLFPELHEEMKLTFRPTIRFWTRDHVLNPDHRAPPRFHSIKKTLFIMAAMDNWRFRLGYIVRLIFPSRELARYSVDVGGPRSSLALVYYRLYKQRLRKLFGGMQGS